ncbi:pyruvate/2-oxoglutarate dehydrogenase complex, dihydrolipoamide dehydrogenase component [Candidatus Nitrososphaera evergladensis SR1]|uniref:Pyruvate/2-oxoglutarate dehydrogenase complex, dihydrolipoamide dehydrogenase component n=1 Tax=Candidatus Nitrososphaera evergladensis SR1 TaxID=1459636 RepID=A0A075MRW1_9ARCH|nr:dihydrolipoyl dehydrogenase [Candidatus Nitrososphaera evergladensis]AIF84246.1 pyruvate/2-oxoglutarate dehydrogenase complex, dihydrolipoamide dehydrogenase component [Candidatus Nitrososphaera evergladensis SR1]
MAQERSKNIVEKFDLIVVGSGAGLDVANAAAQSRLKVALVEKSKMGGTCLNRGCIPSKLLIHSADVAQTIRTAEQFGIRVEKFSVDFEKIIRRTNGIIDSESDGIRSALSEIDNPRLFPVECRFVGKKEILVGQDHIITAERILLASGTRPMIPKIAGLEKGVYITSDEALRLEKQPRVLTIIGGGYIAAELAHFFGSLGTKINIIQKSDMLLTREDEEVSHKFTEILSKKYNVYLGFDTQLITRRNDKIIVSAKRSKTGEDIEIESDQLLLATGRVPNSDTLALDLAGVGTDSRGYIIVDEFLETNVKGIFALGDAVGKYQFRHSANLEAQYAFNNIISHPDKKIPVNYTAMPHAIFSSPQVAAAGYTEQELREKGAKYSKSVYPYAQTAMGEAIEDNDGFVKFLVDKNDGKILGCHILGTDASILIHEVLVSMRAGSGTIGDIQRTVHIHPALSEVVSRAADAIG